MCRTCGTAATPIVYGLPGGELIDAYERGEVVLGGCLIDDVNPLWRCGTCQSSW